MSRQVVAHRRISELLAAEIAEGRLQPGSRLPGEHHLAEQFGVSRGTVRQALGELAGRRLIEARHGAGTFVTFDAQRLDWTVGLARALMEHGVRTHARRLCSGLVVRDVALASRVGLADPRFLAFDRLRELPDGKPVSLERSRVPLTEGTRRLAGLDISGRSLVETLASRLGLVPAESQAEIDVAMLEEEEATALRRDAGSPFLRMRRSLRTREGALIEFVTSLLDPTHFRVQIETQLTGAGA